MTIVNIGIIGCGNIGSLWDEGLGSSLQGPAKTHAKAFFQHPRADIVSMMDSSKQRADQAARHWKASHPTDQLPKQQT